MKDHQANLCNGPNEKTLLDLLREQQIDPQCLVNFCSESIDVSQRFNSLARQSMGEVPYLKRELDVVQAELFVLWLKGELRRDYNHH